MEDNNIIFKNKTIYNKFIDIKKDNNNYLPHLKLQYIKTDSMFKAITNINDLSSIIKYDNLSSSISYNSLNNYYQQYPNIFLNEKTFLNEIYDINNIEDLKKWLNNNKTKNLKTINRIIDLSFMVFYKEINYEYDYFKIYLYNLFTNNFKNLNKVDIKNNIDKSLKEFNIEKNNIITKIILKNLQTL